ncbi:MAG: Na+/H+ antiporter subunit E [Gemmatimonadota bacterium]
MAHTISLGVSMMVVWLLWSGHYDGLMVGLGVLSAAGSAFLARRMYLADPEGHPVHLVGRGLRYAPWLVWSVVKSNLDVARRILSPGLPISPRIVQVRATQRTDLGRAVLANSITITPGTVTVDLEGSLLTVHALTEAAAQDLLTGEMDRRVTAMEGEP